MLKLSEMLKLGVVFIFFSLFLVSCGHPFISIEVRTGGEVVYPYQKPKVDGPEAGCGWPYTVCPGKFSGGKVVDKKEVPPFTFYRLQSGEEFNNVTVPPVVVEGTIEVGDAVEIQISNDGTTTMKKAS
ncbi:hypothetical protein [Candidatus Nitrospira neomarina]|uniref:Uncharacterized protein n=1 Tax=Candidatus Nitrospira neomarina TaxID=3020899 RepID=A0AA96GNH7_9BACT|nr:hypothetical protein [Candidatus Nitrospira neomarina]WNM60746.1 hypothetical protein PQG83_13370 [Candidatus Nitrospira neomarina]